MGLKRITQAELDEILKKHELWLIGDPKGKRAEYPCYDLSGLNFSERNLTRANFSSCDFKGANLNGTNLTGACLIFSDLGETDLSKTDLTGADLRKADLNDTAGFIYPLVCPENGTFTGYKKVHGNYIVELEIPNHASRSSSISRKCRCSSAKVISITNVDGTPADVDTVYSYYDPNFTYTVGDIVKVDNFDENRWHQCAPGIHFFMTRTEAANYHY